MKIVVVGATGGTGQCFVRQALAAGHNVSAIVLPGTDAGTIHERLELVRADVRKPETWADTLDGARGVFSALGAAGWGPTTLCHDGSVAILAAMKSKGLKRLVTVTTAAMTNKTGFIFEKIVTPLFLKNIYGDKEQQERVIRASDTEWVFVRPMRLYDGPRTDLLDVSVGENEKVQGWRVSREDVAAFSLRQFSSDEYVRTGPVLCEPLWMTFSAPSDYTARLPPGARSRSSAGAV